MIRLQVLSFLVLVLVAAAPIRALERTGCRPVSNRSPALAIPVGVHRVGGGILRHGKNRLNSLTPCTRRQVSSYYRSGVGSLRSLCVIPPPGISPLGWDVGMGGVCAVAATAWVKIWTSLARSGVVAPQVSRKVVHTTSGPLFMLLWPFFTTRPSARFIAAGVRRTHHSPALHCHALQRCCRSGI
ncbi:unnamed protein product [Discosporangium mesarthrocarpum]